MSEDSQSRRYLRDNLADDLVEEIDVLLEKVLSLETKVDFAVGYIHEETQKRLDRGREALAKIENALDYLRQRAPKNDEAVMLLIAAAGDIQADQRQIRNGLTTLLGTLNATEQ